jgi:cytoskeletal protein RodZ
MNTSFGETLRKAREAKGLTTSQIAAKTRMLVQIVEEMENEDFHRIAAPIYGRGFVKLYAECVDLDPLPLVKEFMDIYEGRRAPIVRTRDVPVQEQPPAPQAEPPPAVTQPPEPEPTPEPPPVIAQPPEPEPIQEPPPVVMQPPKPEPITEPPPVTAQPPEPEPIPTPVQEPPPVVRGLELFETQGASQAQDANVVPPPATSPKVQPPAANMADIFSGSPYLSTESSYSAEGPSAAERFRKSLSSVSHGVIKTVRDIPRSVWRISLLSITALVLLAILAWGCIKLYNATSIKPIQQPQAIDTTQTPTGTKDPKVSKDSKDLKDPKDLKNPKDPKPTAQSQSKPGNRPAPAAIQAAGKKTPAPTLRTTGQKVPPLYAD